MSNAVCLTARQQKFYNYIINYYKSNGCFPNPTQSARDLNVAAPAVANMYGVLLLKGVFTNGQALTVTYRARHSATPIQPVNIANFKLEPKAKAVKAEKKPATKKPAAKKAENRQRLATLLVQLLSGENIGSKAAADLLAGLSG